jgi:Tol biopolymer transport system component
VSVATSGAQGNNNSHSCLFSISADGRFIAFTSNATNLVAGDTNGFSDVFVRDRQLGVTERVSVDSGVAQANADCYSPSISADGRYVAFASFATNLVPGGTHGAPHVFIRDRLSSTTELVSVGLGGAQANTDSYYPSISADGRYVAFESAASNLVPGDTNGCSDIFVRDLLSGTTARISVDSGGLEANAQSRSPAISSDGRFVAFYSDATNLVAGDTNGARDVFVHDRQLGTTERASIDSGSAEGNDGSYDPSISADARYVAFLSNATNLPPGLTNSYSQVFVRDRQLATTELVSVDSQGVQGHVSSNHPSISADGRYVVFDSIASNLVSGDNNGSYDVFLRDRQNGTTELISVDSAGVGQVNDSLVPSITGDGRYVTFESLANDLVPGNTSAFLAIYVRDRVGGTSFTSLCNPGVAGVIRCPCANPPNGPGRGCDNSSGTGGANLSARGGTFVSSDSLTFATSNENPSSLSILSQWTGTNPTGAIFGMAVRCASGTVKRLYTKTAVGGSITAPDFYYAGDPQVSVRSAALGDVILAGQSRYYLVYYRDPIVLGGCPATSTFNATQTGVVSWSP